MNSIKIKEYQEWWALDTPLWFEAGEGNRTLVICLEGRSSTIELLPHLIFAVRNRGDRTRTCDFLFPKQARYQLRHAPKERHRYSITPSEPRP